MEQVTKAKQGKYNYFKELIKNGESISIDSVIMAYKKNHKSLLNLMLKGNLTGLEECHNKWDRSNKMSRIMDVCYSRGKKDKETNKIFFECLKQSNTALDVIKKFKEDGKDYKEFLGEKDA